MTALKSRVDSQHLHHPATRQSFYWGLAGSFALHVGIVVTLGLLVVAITHGDGGGRHHYDITAFMDQEFLSESDAPIADLQSPIELATPMSTVKQSISLAAAKTPALPKASTVPNSATPSAETSSLTERVGALMSRATGTGGTGPAGEAGGGDGNGTGTADGKGEGKFFGASKTGEKFVFVVDCSASMNHPHPGPANTRFRRVRLELFRSISTMTAEQQFFVIFFNQYAHYMPAEGMVKATPENQESAYQWINSCEPEGNTDPEAALLAAIKLKPDVIYFLTDGNFPQAIAERVSAANVAKTTIHTIGFDNAETAPLLEAMANANAGTCKLIVPRDDHYWTGSRRNPVYVP